MVREDTQEPCAEDPVSRKHQKHKAPPTSTEDLRARIQKSRREGRLQQALDLARQLYKASPIPANLQILKETTLERARQLRTQGNARDAANTLEVAARLDEQNPQWLRVLGEEMARTGEAARTMAFLARLPAESQPPTALGPVADGFIIGQETANLPPDWKDDRERILSAFRQLEAGDDEGAKTSLQGVGLRSPFLEWKVFLRGLQAFYQNDDTRALENWGRLDPQRAPARLAAPFRLHLDSVFAAAQPPNTQMALRHQYERLQGEGLLPGLRAVRTAMGHTGHLAGAFRHVENILPALRERAPQLVPRLATCFYWAVIHTGPDDILRYQRVFGKPHDDPGFHRLRALAYDQASDLESAHREWQRYEAEIAERPEVFGSQTALARALIWLHLGRNAARVPTAAQMAKLPWHIREQIDLSPLSPSAETCYRKSLELAPGLLEANDALFSHLIDLDQHAKAEKIGQKLLERFPHHVSTLERLAELRADKNPAEAVELLQEAVHHNPLDRGLRSRLGSIRFRAGRAAAVKGDLATARQQWQAALDLVHPGLTVPLLVLWSVAEQKADNLPEAERLREKAREANTGELLLRYLTLASAIQLKVPAKVKKEYDKEFAAGLAGPADAHQAAVLTATLAALRMEKIEYTGLKTHTNKILTYVNKCRDEPFTEEQLLALTASLSALQPTSRVLANLLMTGQRKFPNTPEFFLMEASSEALKGDSARVYRIQGPLSRAEPLVQKLPPGERRERLLEVVENLKEQVHAMNPWARMMDSFSGFMDSFGFMDDEDDDDEDEW
jgi:tetratricopeptide (TPR) repeat protein